MLSTDTTPKKVMMDRQYRNTSHIDMLEEEIKALENPDGETEFEETLEQPPKKDPEESSEEKTFKKRYGDLRRHTQKQEEEWKKKFEDLEAKMAKGNAVMPKTKEEVEAWVKKYPDVASIVKGLVGEEVQERSREADRRLKEIEEMSQQVALERAEAELRKVHPDFDDIRSSDEFHSWADEQPKWIQNALYDDVDVRATSRAIDLYKSDKGIKGKSPDKNAALSVGTRNRAATPQTDASVGWWSESRVQKMTDKEYTEKEDEILSAMREGKFKYDLSQKAR